MGRLNQMPLKILLVVSDGDLLDGTAEALSREGFTLSMARDGEQALRQWRADQPDVVVLEVALPGRSGFDVCRTIRKSGSTPVILLSAQTTDEQVVHGFRVGADDYLGKPVRPRELALRIRAVWRRVAETGARPSEQEVRVASLDLVLEPETHGVYRGRRPIHLTPLEFRLLRQLASNAGRMVPAERLVISAWGYDAGDTKLLKTHMTKIRKKLQLPREGPGSLSAVSGVGYRLTR